MSKKGFGRRVLKLRIDGKIHLVKTRWANPALTSTIKCAFCNSHNTRPVMDIIQHGMFDDKMHTYFLCADCQHVTEFRYKVECYSAERDGV